MHITLETAHTEMQSDETISHMVTGGQSDFCTSARRMRDCRQNHHDCRQKTLDCCCFGMLSWPHSLYVKSHDKYMFLFARDLYEYIVHRSRIHRALALNSWHLKSSTNISATRETAEMLRSSGCRIFEKQLSASCFNTLKH